MTAPVLSRPEVPTARPWTLAETLAVLRERRLVLDETSRGLRARHRHVHDLPGLDEALDAHAPVLRVWIRLGGAGARVPAPWRADGWDEPTRLLAAWFGLLFEPPEAPFALRPGEAVTDWRRFREALAGRLALGPCAPSADDVRDALARLFVRFGMGEQAAAAQRVRQAA
jgi:hypothetical protein